MTWIPKGLSANQPREVLGRYRDKGGSTAEPDDHARCEEQIGADRGGLSPASRRTVPPRIGGASDRWSSHSARRQGYGVRAQTQFESVHPLPVTAAGSATRNWT